MQTYQTWIRMPNGQSIQVFVQAQSAGDAKQLFEAQYGGSGAKILHLPTAA